MIPLPAWLYAAIGGILATVAAWFGGIAHGEAVARDAMTAKINATIVVAQKVNDENEELQRTKNAATGSSYAADAVAIAASAAVVDTGGMRFRACPRVDLPEAAASRPAPNGTGIAASGVGTVSVDFEDLAKEVVRLGAERDRLAAKVAGLQKTIRDQPGYTDGKQPADIPNDRK